MATLHELVARAFLGRDPDEILNRPLDSLPHTHQALVFSAVAATLPELAIEALEYGTTWADLEHWLHSAEAPEALAGGRAVLRPIEPADVPSLFTASLDPSRSHRWRFRGRTQSFDSFAASMDDGVLAQFTVCTRGDRSVAGLVVAYNADLSNGHVYVGMLRVSPAGGAGLLVEAAALFLNYLFTRFPFRQVYFEFVGPNRDIVEPLVDLGIAEQVARYPRHSFGPEGFEDLTVYMMTRHAWNRASLFWFPRDESLEGQQPDGPGVMPYRPLAAGGD